MLSGSNPPFGIYKSKLIQEFRLFWRWKSQPGRTRIPDELQARIWQMARQVVEQAQIMLHTSGPSRSFCPPESESQRLLRAVWALQQRGLTCVIVIGARMCAAFDQLYGQQRGLTCVIVIGEAALRSVMEKGNRFTAPLPPQSVGYATTGREERPGAPWRPL